jgi:hypothetical protein
MNGTHLRAFFLFSAVLLPYAPVTAQSLHPRSSVPAGQKLSTLPHKQVIEQHFESPHPVARPQLGGIVPGAQLIERHRQRAAALQQRGRVNGSPATPRASVASGATVLPGLLMRPSLGAGSYPTAVVSGDFNNDGHIDFVVANGNTSDLWIYLGNGDGSFQLPRIIPLSQGLSPLYLAAADLRGSGQLDLVVAEFDTSTVGVLRGNGNGTFGYEQIYTLPQPPGALVVSDFNHDGKPDIAAVMITYNTPTAAIPYVAMFSGNGDGSFANPVITYNSGFYSDVYNVDSADVNGDGFPDLLITGPDLDNSTIYLNNGDGRFTKGQEVVAYTAFNDPVDGRLADVNGDGCPDAVVADINTSAWVALGNCAGTFGAPKAIPMGQGNAAVRVLDVNGDGHPDLLASSEIVQELNGSYTAGNTVSVALGDGKGNFGLAHVYGGNSEALSLTLADFKGNGRPSIVTSDIDTDTATIYPNDGNGNFGFPQGIFADQSSQGLSVVTYSDYSFVDLNGDGTPDIFQIGTGSDFYAESFLNDGAGHFNSPMASGFGTGTSVQVLGDYRLGNFRNTGHLDLVAIGSNTAYDPSSQVIFFQPSNGDGTFGKATSFAITGADGLMTTGDLNGDGKLDFVVVNGALTHTLTPFLGNGDGSFRMGNSITFSDSNEEIARVYSGDFNRDGRNDVLVFATSNGYFTPGSAVWEFDGNGDGTFQSGRELFTGFQPFTLADLNNDGHPDIARYDFFWPDGTTQTPGPVKFTNYLGQPDGSFQQSSSYTPYAGMPQEVEPYTQFGDPLTSSMVGDFNADGKIDEVAFQTANVYARDAQILMGNGDGSFTPTYDLFPFAPYVYPLYGHDFDGDGFTDMLSFDYGSAGLMIQRGGPAPALQITLAHPILTGTNGCGTIYADVISSADRTVSLFSSVSGVTLPGSVVLPANANSTTFCYTLSSSYDWHQVYDVRAALDGSTATAYGSQAYISGFSVSVSGSNLGTVYGGQNTPPVTVTVTAQPGYTSTVNLSCDGFPPGYSCQFSPNQIAIAPGAPASATLVVTTAPGYFSSPIVLIASDGNIIQRQSVTLNVAALNISSIASSSIEDESPGTSSELLLVYGIPPYALSCTGLPSGASCSFSGNQAAFPNASSITASVTTSAGLPTGNSHFQVVVNSGGLSASSQQTLGIFSLTLQAPSAAQDWTPPNSKPTVNFPVQSSNLPGGSITIGCTLDGSAVCQTLTMGLGAASTSVFQTLRIPAGITSGQHQLNLTTTFYGVEQNYTFPYYIAEFSGSLSGSAVAISVGSSATVTGTLNATTGFSDAVTLSCSAPVQITCTLTPSSVKLTSAGPQTFTVALGAGSVTARRSAPGTHHLVFGQGLLALAGLLPLGRFLRRRCSWKTLLGALVCVCLLSSIVACGSGGSSSSGGGGSGGIGGTGGGSSSYTVTVSASASGTTDMQTLGSVAVKVNN